MSSNSQMEKQKGQDRTAAVQGGREQHLLLERLHTEFSRSISDFSVDFLAISIATFRSSIHLPISRRVLQGKK